MYLFVELENEFLPRKQELIEYVKSLFGEQNVHLTFKHLVKREDVKSFLDTAYAGCEDKLIWFGINDDHVFVDIDTDVLEEGLTLVKNDKSKFKTLYYSHWPEVLRLSGKLNNQERVGNYVKFTATLLDAIQIFNLNYLRYLYGEVVWNFNESFFVGREHKKIEALILQSNIWTDPKAPYRYAEGLINSYVDNLQTIYVPLRELARHFDGYSHVKMRLDDLAEYPEMKLPKELNLISYTPSEIIRRIHVHHESLWTDGNTFKIPDEWVNTILALYSKKTYPSLNL
jgi:hypothetical protein